MMMMFWILRADCCRSIGRRFDDDYTAIAFAPTISVENCQPLEEN